MICASRGSPACLRLTSRHHVLTAMGRTLPACGSDSPGGADDRCDAQQTAVVRPTQPPHTDLLRTAVDAVLVPAGFAAAQGDVGGGPGECGGLVWCAPWVEFAARHTHLPPAEEDVTASGNTCVDVVVELCNDSGTWVTSSVRLEDRDLDDVAAGLGDLGGAARARALVGADARAAALALPDLLADLLRSAEDD
jgi:hypothetical protein